MADTTFTNGVTVTDADWFNDLNRLHYTIFGDPAGLAAAQGTFLTMANTLTGISFAEVAPTNGYVISTALTLAQESTWTPALRFGGASVGMAYTTQTAHCYRVRNMVYFTLNITLSAKGSSTGTATIVLPYQANTFIQPSSVGVATLHSMTTAATDPYWKIDASGTVLTLYNDRSTTSTPVALTDTAFASNSAIICSGCYFAQ